MKKNILLIFCLSIIFTPNFHSQFDTSGFTIQHHKLFSNKFIVNNNISDYYRNSSFKTSFKKNTSIQNNESDSIISIYSLEKPFKNKKFIYINPAEKYIDYQNRSDHFINEYFYLNYVFNNSKKKYDYDNQPILPNSIRYYIDPTLISSTPKQIQLNINSSCYIPENIYLTPFYFSKNEITNAEYREFTNYVIDSVAKQILYNEWMENLVCGAYGQEDYVFDINEPIDWENEDVIDMIYDTIFNIIDRKFYTRKEYNTNLMNYKYSTVINDVSYDTTINIYPDTLCWLTDFPACGWSYEPIIMAYNWHPAYDNHPVLGVNYYQALAFLDWKTKKLQKDINKKGYKIRVQLDLPTEAEWDMVATAEIVDKEIEIFTLNYPLLSDDNWITDLSLEYNKIKHYYNYTKTKEGSITNATLRSDFLFETNNKEFIIKHQDDKYVETYPVTINKKKEENLFLLANIDNFGICHMGSNVSEWLKESYQENWQPIFCKRQEMLSTFDAEDVKILAMMEAYYDRKNHPEGRLVKGANWYDERFSNILGKNIEGINAKVFADPNRGYSTVGFRYVIRVYPAN